MSTEDDCAAFLHASIVLRDALKDLEDAIERNRLDAVLHSRTTVNKAISSYSSLQHRYMGF